MKKTLLFLFALLMSATIAYAAGDGTKENPYTVEDLKVVKPKNNSYCWCKGYIVGWNAGAAFAPNVTFSAAGAANNNIVLADTPEETNTSNLLYTTNNNVADLSIQSHPELIGKQVAIYGQIANMQNWQLSMAATGSDFYFIEEGGSDEPTEVTFDFTAAGFNDKTAMTEMTKDGIKLVPDGGGNSNKPIYYTKGTAMRFYGGNTLTVSTSSEKLYIVKIDFVTETSQPFKDTNKASVGAITIASNTSATWDYSAGTKSVVLTPMDASTGHVRIQKMTVYLGEQGEQFAEAPVFSPESQMIDKNSLVTLTSATEGAKIYYTTNGNDPKVGEAGTMLYTEPGILVTANTTIKAMATAEGMTNSPVVTKEYMVPVEVKTIEAFVTTADANNWYKFTGVLTVTYANGARCFVKDNTGSMLLYSNDLRNMELPNGTMINGVVGKYNRYLDMIPQLENIVASTVSTLAGGPVDPVESTIGDITNASMSEYLLIKDAVITKHEEQDNTDNKYAANYWTITDATGARTLYNQFGVEVAATPEGKVADVVVIPSYYGNDIQLYVISYTEKDAPVQGDLEDGDGTEENPYTIEQILAMGSVPDQTWVKGYFVGLAGGSLSNWDTVFGAPSEQQINAYPHPIIAGSASCKDVKQALVLYTCTNELLQLKNKPEQLGKLFAVQIGNFIAPYNAAAQTFAVKELGGTVPPAEPGTEENPYTVEQVLNLSNPDYSDQMWVEGYLVGAYPSGWELVRPLKNVVFGKTGDDLKDFQSAVIADTPDCTDVNKVFGLAYALDEQELLNIKKNPGQLYKKFLIKFTGLMGGAPTAVETLVVKELASSGITGVEADTNAPVEYFNLQGMPVGIDNLRSGNVYIRRQGGSVTKIMVK